MLTQENLSTASPGRRPAFLHLGADCLDIIAILGHKASQVIELRTEHLDPFQHIATAHQKLLLKS
jgi:hypothetical protein